MLYLGEDSTPSIRAKGALKRERRRSGRASALHASNRSRTSASRVRKRSSKRRRWGDKEGRARGPDDSEGDAVVIIVVGGAAVRLLLPLRLRPSRPRGLLPGSSTLFLRTGPPPGTDGLRCGGMTAPTSEGYRVGVLPLPIPGESLSPGAPSRSGRRRACRPGSGTRKPPRKRDAFEARRSLASLRLFGDLGVVLRLHY